MRQPCHYLVNFWSFAPDAFRREHIARLEALLVAVRTCVEESYTDYPFLAGGADRTTGCERLQQCRGLTRVLESVRRVAPTRATVLIQGESGTGKEIVAEALYELSARKDRRFVRVNCGALTESLLESELFGHVRGAFTGAIENKAGFFEYASGGTLFLDEVGELSLQAQARLLRVIDTGTLQRIDSPETMPVDVRLITATNRDLLQMVREKTFRRDLYYRLAVYRIALPPLREHTVDIEPLVRFFLRRKAADYQSEAIPMPSREELQKLQEYSWPGNIRELQNVVERALIDRCGRQPGAPVHFDLELEMSQEEAKGTLEEWPTLEGLEKQYIGRVLKKCHYRLTGPRGAAALLGIHYTTLRAKMEKYGLR
ncbi:MAG TPA: sigma 54-interacting transcriptional regulator [Candidatus Desulfovibrio intestinipullorum]|uniref:Sigma 54-interacting transcriptional regulator n=1 Tax=Candidatus Desulfovibrio intestinipullorum TaxID=2838536 RepID=A0A9D1PY69_9BACT|nr:sigma 54-interacting transcriptional regulator [Candidatus Desulfovibrio intestinipullorum]